MSTRGVGQEKHNGTIYTELEGRKTINCRELGGCEIKILNFILRELSFLLKKLHLSTWAKILNLRKFHGRFLVWQILGSR